MSSAPTFRSPKPSKPQRPWIIQRRDIDGWIELYHGPLTRDQAMRLLGWGSLTRFNTRFALYVAEGFVSRLRLPFFGQSVYTLGPAAVPVVAAELGLDAATVRTPAKVGSSPDHLLHSLRVADAKISTLDACRIAGLPVVWRSERQARHAYRVRVGTTWRENVVRPDAYARIGSAQAAVHCFFEVDMGHRSMPAMERTMAGYVRYADSVFRSTYGAEAFLVLCIVPGSLRATHMAEAARKAGAGMFRIATFADFFPAGLLERIWRTPAGGVNACTIVPGTRGAA